MLLEGVDGTPDRRRLTSLLVVKIDDGLVFEEAFRVLFGDVEASLQFIDCPKGSRESKDCIAGCVSPGTYPVRESTGPAGSSAGAPPPFDEPATGWEIISGEDSTYGSS